MQKLDSTAASTSPQLYRLRKLSSLLPNFVSGSMRVQLFSTCASPILTSKEALHALLLHDGLSARPDARIVLDLQPRLERVELQAREGVS